MDVFSAIDTFYRFITKVFISQSI